MLFWNDYLPAFAIFAVSEVQSTSRENESSCTNSLISFRYLKWIRFRKNSCIILDRSNYAEMLFLIRFVIYHFPTLNLLQYCYGLVGRSVCHDPLFLTMRMFWDQKLSKILDLTCSAKTYICIKYIYDQSINLWFVCLINTTVCVFFFFLLLLLVTQFWMFF